MLFSFVGLGIFQQKFLWKSVNSILKSTHTTKQGKTTIQRLEIIIKKSKHVNIKFTQDQVKYNMNRQWKIKTNISLTYL